MKNKNKKRSTRGKIKHKAIMRKKQSGITLIALVITIIIIIILATVTINMAFGENGLIREAELARDLTANSLTAEEEGMNNAVAEYANLIKEDGEIQEPDVPNIPTTVAEAIEDEYKFIDTTTITDALENTIYVPGGFHLDKESNTDGEGNAITVENGIVIEDGDGNQFVWIPTGTYKVSKNLSSTEELTNVLSRRIFEDGKETLVSGDTEIDSHFYGEGTEGSCTIVNGKNSIEEFLKSANPITEGGNGGFYIGRYEAGTDEERTSEEDELTIPLVQDNKDAYVFVDRDQAKTQAELMYSGNKFVTSQLISSYAWDTALNFICQTNNKGYTLATTLEPDYANIATDEKAKTGRYTKDKYSNIYDLLGNCYEWTTEFADSGHVYRGGYYHGDEGYASCRDRSSEGSSRTYRSFRIQLYVNDTSN